jgi:hypothetical protein
VFCSSQDHLRTGTRDLDHPVPCWCNKHRLTLTKLGCEIKNDLATDVILQSLSVSYELFIINFHMNNMEKTMVELHGMLKIAE